MKNLNYDELKQLEIGATKRLLSYIHSNIDINEILNELDFEHSYFLDDANKLAFNLWLGIDYIWKNDKTFVETLLEDKSFRLTSWERKILTERIDSHVSIFEVISYEDEYINVRDALNNEFFKLWEPNLYELIEEGEFVFSRIGKSLDNYGFIGDINHLPQSVKPMFIESVLMDFNHIREDIKNLTIKEYLKKFTLNIYKIYDDAILNIIDLSEDIDSFLSDEIDEFRTYLESKENRCNIKKHITNLLNISEYCLINQDMTLYDLDQIDMEDLFDQAIEDEFINSKDELNSYIGTLKKYLSFLNKRYSQYNEVYNDILHISENRFFYMSRLGFQDSFQLDRRMVQLIGSKLNNNALSITMDFDKFILYCGGEVLELTDKNKYIKKKNLIEINNILELKTKVHKKSPTQRNFPIIELFYYLGLDLGLLSIEDNQLVLGKRSTNYLRLNDEEKFVLIFQYLWGKDFINKIVRFENVDYFKELLNMLIKEFSCLKKGDDYAMDQNPAILSTHYEYLKYMGLINYNFQVNYNIKVTNLGEKVFKYLAEDRYENKEARVIYLDIYKETKECPVS
ncbi:hypothetical protein [Wansuia hejianensis]|uniref:Uncharacterized protein n=1 Tax=Wansuia hejianensis TaxID=2763667 RepID=A0A926F127_9FIRM|nr:hypothetical protein [Wansuia hejianensis]MBC8590062.1 hypothetical protein [Wansuia hejianensis]